MAFTWQPINFINDDPSTPLSAENLAAVQAGITQAGQLADGKLSNVSVGSGLNGDGTSGNPLGVDPSYFPSIVSEPDLDFDSLKQSGFFYFSGNTTNGPVAVNTAFNGFIFMLATSEGGGFRGFQFVFNTWNGVLRTDLYIRFISGTTWTDWKQITGISDVASAMSTVFAQQPMKLNALSTPESVTPELQSYIDERVQSGINEFIQRFAAAYPMPTDTTDEQAATVESGVKQAADNE